MAPVLVTLKAWMTLKVIPRLQAFSSAICQTFVQYFTRFQLTTRSHCLSATDGLLVFNSEVALLWKKDYRRKTVCVWLCGYDAAYCDLLFLTVSVEMFSVLVWCGTLSTKVWTDYVTDTEPPPIHCRPNTNPMAISGGGMSLLVVHLNSYVCACTQHMSIQRRAWHVWQTCW